MKEDINIIEILENTCQDWHYFVDDDIGGHFEKVRGNQIANTNLNYLTFKAELENLIKAYKEIKQDKVHLENLILREYVSKFIIKEELKKAEERYKTYKAELKENENLKFGMWRHLGEVHMCKKLLGIEINIATLDANTNNNAIENDIKQVEDYIKHFEGKLVDIVAIGNLSVGYKNLEKENKELWYANTKLAEENTKLNKVIEEKDNDIQRMQELLDLSDANNASKALEISKLNKEIDKITEYLVEVGDENIQDIACDNCGNYGVCLINYNKNCIKKYFREEVENNE